MPLPRRPEPLDDAPIVTPESMLAPAQNHGPADPPKTETAKKRKSALTERRSRGILVHPAIYKAIQALALSADVKDYEAVDAAFVEYLQRRRLLPKGYAGLVAELRDKGLLQEDSPHGSDAR